MNILQCDGGGTRGYGQAVFLEKYPTLYNNADLLTGVSAGAINTSALAFGLSATELKNFYLQKAPYIFTIRSASDLLSNNASKPSNRPDTAQKIAMLLRQEPFYLSVSDNSNYGDALLKRTFNEIFGDTKVKDLGKKIIIVAYSITQNKPVFFTNIDVKFKNILTISDVLLSDAVLCSMSAPFYFPRTNLHINPDPEAPDDILIDGGMVENSPYLEALHLAITQGSYRNCVCSLSTGQTKPNFSNLALTNGLGEILPLLDVAMNQYLHEDFLQMFANLANSSLFFYRLNFELLPEYSDLDNSTAEYFDWFKKTILQTINKDEAIINNFINRWNDPEGKGLENNV